MKKANWILAAIMAVSLVFGVSSCSNGSDSDDDDSDDSVVYKTVFEDVSSTVTFKNDNTFVQHVKYSDVIDGISCIMDLDSATGSYSGDPSKDGTISVTTTKRTNLSDSTITVLCYAALQKGETSVVITNEKAPLKTVQSPETETITISDGKFQKGEALYTRQ